MSNPTWMHYAKKLAAGASAMAPTRARQYDPSRNPAWMKYARSTIAGVQSVAEQVERAADRAVAVTASVPELEPISGRAAEVATTAHAVGEAARELPLLLDAAPELPPAVLPQPLGAPPAVFPPPPFSPATPSAQVPPSSSKPTSSHGPAPAAPAAQAATQQTAKPASNVRPTAAKTPVSKDPSTNEAARIRQAAETLLAVLKKKGANFGDKAHPSTDVMAFQRVARLVVDGIVGPDVRSAAGRVGVTLPQRPAAIKPAKPSLVPPSVIIGDAVLKPLQPTSNDSATKRSASVTLDHYLRSPNANFGDKAHPSESVRTFQHATGLKQDGIVGPDVRAEAKKWGVTLPPRGMQSAPHNVESPAQPTATAVAVEHIASGVSTTPKSALSSPTEYNPIFQALASLGSARSDAETVQHFAVNRTGLVAHMRAESGNAPWTSVSKEVPAQGETSPRFSYGPIQILEDTAPGLYARRTSVSPYSANMRPVPAKAVRGSGPNATMKAALLDQTSGAWYVVAFIMQFDAYMRARFDWPLFMRTGVLNPLAGQGPSAKKVADYVNAYSKAHPLTDPVATLLRMYGGASSIAGMAHLIDNGHSDSSLGRMSRYYSATAAA